MPVMLIHDGILFELESLEQGRSCQGDHAHGRP